MSATLIGKMVTIRHATSSDRVRVGAILSGQGGADALCEHDELVVAAENERIIGFGIMKKEGNSGSIALYENSGRKGIGTVIVRHLAEHTDLKHVYATRYACYFAEFEFAGRRHRRRTACRPGLLERVPIRAEA